MKFWKTGKEVQKNQPLRLVELVRTLLAIEVSRLVEFSTFAS